MKRILGLDLGTTSIGWALVNETEDKKEKSSIIKTGVRIIQMDNFVNSSTGKESKDPLKDFLGGNGISPNAGRTAKRGARRSLQRYKLRRKELIKILAEYNLISNDTILAEEGKNTTHSLWKLRAKTVTEGISLKDFSRVLLAINKKRGYKSNRKAKDEGDGQAVDGMEVAKILIDKKMTSGQYVLDLLNDNKKYIPDFYRSDLENEFDKVWDFQKQFYTDILTDKLKKDLKEKNKTQTWAICKETFNIVGVKRTTKRGEQKKENYQWRVDGLSKQLDLEQLAIVFQEINNQINQSSGLLGKISDRSKALYFNNETVGQYLYNQIKENPHTPLKNQVFYRQDYLDEFNKIWKRQAKFHLELTQELKEILRDGKRIDGKMTGGIFYQRRLKSQKGLINICEMEGKEIKLKDKEGKPVINEKGEAKRKIIGPRVIPKSSPLFQEFKIWSILNNLEFRNIKTKEKVKIKEIDEDLEIRKKLFTELNTKGKLTSNQILKLSIEKPKEWELNYKDGLEGNNTNQVLFKAYKSILDLAGYENIDVTKIEKTSEIFDSLGINKEILFFDAELEGKEFEKQASYQFWHLLYSYEDDNSKTGNEKLFYHLKEKFGLKKEYAQTLINISFKDDYGSLSSKAIKKIIPFLKEGNDYSEACALAGYNHSHSVTKEENEKRILKDALELLPKNSLRNPVVEKILNQMVNVINAIIKEYGKPDEIRIELARELKKSAKERKEATKSIASATKIHNEIREKLKKFYPFNTGVRITKKDIIKYKLWQELESNGHKTIYTNTYVSLEKLFTKEFDVEHIIPKALLFDDSFSNKTLSVREFNRWKSNKTGIDAIEEKYKKDSKDYNRYVSVIGRLYEKYQKTKKSNNPKGISKAKYNKLLMKSSEIPDGFIERDLRNTQYIAKKAKEMLQEVFRTVTPITGIVTSKLRDDWQLINVMQELNWNKYDKLEPKMTRYEENKLGQKIPRIIGWTKRNDHRHHAMDALTVAFTKHNHIQYYNYLNARRDKNHKQHANIYAIEQKETYYNDDKNKRLMKSPMPINEFRAEAKKHLVNTLISFKVKNKVATRNKNITKKKVGRNIKVELTPRGQLHKETVYGKSKRPMKKVTKISKKLTLENVHLIIDKNIRKLVLNHLKQFDNISELAFDTKILKRQPLLYKGEPLKDVLCFKEIFTIRKDISPGLFKDSKKKDIFYKKIEDDKFILDKKVRDVLTERYNKTKAEIEPFNKTAEKTKQKKVLETAFTNLEENPIWLNEEKGIQIKRVTITGVSNAKQIHHKKDHFGNEILDKNSNPIPADYVSTGNNHHVAIYRDEKGNLFDYAVSFSDAVKRKIYKLPIIPNDTTQLWDKIFKIKLNNQSFLSTFPKNGLKLIFSMKQNEMFVFPNKETGFNPVEIDLLDVNNYHLISPNLFRIQKLSKVDYENSSVRDYVFRHHLETTVKENKVLKETTYKAIKSLSNLQGIIKVRINHIGKIVKVGEY